EPLLAADDGDQEDAVAELEGGLHRVSNARALAGLGVGRGGGISPLWDIGGGALGDAQDLAPSRMHRSALGGRRGRLEPIAMRAGIRIGGFESGVADHEAIYDNFDGVLLVFVQLDVFAKVADLAIYTDAHIAGATHVLKDALILAFAPADK